jgi:sulfite reductase alpha subunit-like flavoprotein
MKNSDEHTNDEITILYGSQTGTAQGFAENLAKDVSL